MYLMLWLSSWHFCSCVTSILQCSSHLATLATKNALSPCELNVWNSLRCFSPLAFSAMCLMSTSNSSGPSGQSSSSSMSSSRLSLLSKYCTILAVTAVSRAVHRCWPPYPIPQLQYSWSSSSLRKGVLLGGGHGLCCGVGGTIFLPVAGAAFKGAPSKFISFLTFNKKRLALSRERKVL